MADDVPASMHASERARRKDFLYRVLMPLNNDCTELKSCVKGIKNMMDSHKDCHPSLQTLLNSEQDTCTERALVLFGLYSLSPFLRFVIEREDACSSAVSLFTHCFLAEHVSRFLDGECSLSDFVEHAVADYICT